MPLHLPFNFPYYRRIPTNYYNNSYVPHNVQYQNNTQTNQNENHQDSPKKEDSSNDNHSESSDYFFDIFGLRLHFDDVLIICILFFLYKEEVQDQELFLCLILLLIS